MQVGYLISNQKRLFYILHKATEFQHVILYIPPFAEEQNKSRAMISQTAKTFAKAGQSVLMLDLYATGDSQGLLQTATWQDWLQNINDAVLWLQQQGFQEISLWGLRLGCLLISDYLLTSTFQFKQLLFWQPILKGKLFLKQFLRLKVAAEMSSKNPPTVKKLQIQLEQTGELEIAGYLINQSLAQSIEMALLEQTNLTFIGQLNWFEINPNATLSPASQKIIAAWQEDYQCSITSQSITAEPFWLTQEMTIAHKLKQQSMDVF